MKYNRAESGNVLWFILVGIVLLGALTMILSRSGSSVDQSGDVEKLNVQASQIMRYAKSLEAGVQNMKIQGISENEISFANSDSATDYTNTSCDAADDRNYPYCLMFDSQGGGLNYKIPSASWLDSAQSAETYYGDWLITGASCIPNVGTGDSPGDCNSSSRTAELLLILPYIKKSLCQRINILAKAPISTANPPVESGTAWDDGSAQFTGSFSIDRHIADNPTVDIQNIYTGCFEGGGGTPAASTYHFYHVLLAR